MMHVVLVCTLLMAPAAVADDDTVTVKDLETLLTLGYGEDEILEYLKRDGITIDVSAADIDRLEKQKMPAGVVSFLRTKRAAADRKTLDVPGVIALWKGEKDEELIKRRVRESDSKFDLSVAETLALDRAGVPASLIRFLREARDESPPTDEPVTAGDVVRLTALGQPDDEIIGRIRRSDSHFSLTAADLIQLNRDGVAREVLKEMYARNRAPEEPVAPPAAMAPAPGNAAPLAAAAAELEIHRDRGGGYSLLVPKSFVSTKEYRGRKALVQMIERAPEKEDELPALELSVLTVHPKAEERDRLDPSRLPDLARKFVDDLTRRFAAEQIQVASRPPESTWLSNRPAVRVATKATTGTGVGYLGANYLLVDEQRIYVVSYSARLERGHDWRELFETCARSLVLDDAARPWPAVADTSADDQARTLFERWRISLKRFDFDGYRRLHDALADDLSARLSFVRAASDLARRGQRLEIKAADTDNSRVEYHAFGLDGRTTHRLALVKTEGGWLLAAPRAAGD